MDDYKKGEKRGDNRIHQWKLPPVSLIVIYKMIASFTFLFYQETWIFISIFSWVYYE